MMKVKFSQQLEEMRAHYEEQITLLEQRNAQLQQPCQACARRDLRIAQLESMLQNMLRPRETNENVNSQNLQPIYSNHQRQQ